MKMKDLLKIVITDKALSKDYKVDFEIAQKNLNSTELAIITSTVPEHMLTKLFKPDYKDSEVLPVRSGFNLVTAIVTVWNEKFKIIISKQEEDVTFYASPKLVDKLKVSPW